MKKITTSILVTVCLLVALVTASAQTTTSGVNIINSANSTTNGVTTTATNGLYTVSMAPATTETNLVCLNPGYGYGNTISVQFTANAMASTSTNTAVLVLSTTAGPITIAGVSTNATANPNWLTSTSARSIFQTVTLTFSGTRVTTNLVFYPTTGYCAGTKLYVETVGFGSASTGNFLTNYTVSAVSGL